MKILKTVMMFAFAIVFPPPFLAILFCMGMFQLTKFLIVKGYNKWIKTDTPSIRIEPSMNAEAF
jgi:hypothetical protein